MLKIFPAGGVGLLEREQQRVGDVLGVAVVVQGEAVVGDDDAVAAVEDAAHDDPLTRGQLVRAVHVRVAEVRGVGVARRTPPPRCGRCGSPSRRPPARRPSGASSPTGTGSPGGSYSHAFIQPRYAGTPPTEITRPVRPREHLGDHPQPPVHRVGDVERAAVRASARRASSSKGSAWRCSTASGVSARSWVPRWRMVTRWPRSTSPWTSGMPVGPVPADHQHVHGPEATAA